MEENLIISLQNLVKKFDSKVVVDNFCLDVKKGEFVTFLGPSGCGKTTTLRMIAGFELPTSGTILLNGKDVSKLPPYKRPINTVFQRYALFPHLDVYDNIAFGLKLKKIPYETKDRKGNVVTKYRHLTNEEIDKKIIHALEIVDLEEMEDRDISTLSGGQQQRVAIARAIVNEPEILLLDEPLGALDLKMRKDMQLELKDMHKRLGITFIYVTHDQEEALTMSDKIVVMKDGVIQQVGTPEDIYNEPVNAFVADFIGESNIFNGTMVGKLKVKFLNQTFDCVDDFPVNEKVDVVVRPEDIEIKKDGKVKGHIAKKVFKGVHYEYVIMVGKNEVVAQSTKNFEIDTDIAFDVEKENIQIMNKEYTINSYYDAWIDDKNRVVIGDTHYECDVTKMFEGSSLDEEGYLHINGKRYDLNDADVVAEVELNDVELSDDLTGQDKGTVLSQVWLGDHYQYLVRTENDEDFVVNTEYLFNENDIVGIAIKKEAIKLRLKGDISKYEKE